MQVDENEQSKRDGRNGWICSESNESILSRKVPFFKAVYTGCGVWPDTISSL